MLDPAARFRGKSAGAPAAVKKRGKYFRNAGEPV